MPRRKKPFAETERLDLDGGDSIDLIVALGKRMVRADAERSAYLTREAAKEAEAMAYVEMVMKLRKKQKR